MPGSSNFYHSLMLIMLFIVANCGHPEILLKANDSVPSIEDYNGLLIEGTTIRLSCPPGLELIGPNSATCTNNGEWEPDLNSLMCNDSKGFHTVYNYYL